MSEINSVQNSFILPSLVFPQRKIRLIDKVYNFLHMIFVVTKGFFNLSDYKISHIDLDKIPLEFRNQLKEFEASFTYPFSSEERFRIEHGVKGDYFAFFKQLGKVHYYVATCKTDKTITKFVNGEKVTIHRKAGEIAAVGCGILRTMKTYQSKSKKAWYICDVKVGEKYQGERLPLMLMQKGAWRFFQCPRGYGICMNPAQGQPKAAEIWRKHGPISKLDTKMLNLYTLTAEQCKKQYRDIELILRKHQYLQQNEHLVFKSTAGNKDYQIFGKNAAECHPWKLSHAQPSVTSEHVEPQPGFTHMISAVEGTPLNDSLKVLLEPATSTAQVVNYGMETLDLNFLTSNQI